MKTEKIEKEIKSHGNRKTVLGVRCYSELKGKLSNEAKTLDISISEHAENILLNNNILLKKIQDSESEIENLKVDVTKLNEVLAYTKSQFTEKELNFNNAVEGLKKEILELKGKLIVYSNPRLLELFRQLEGKKDSIIKQNGETVNFVYKQPKDLLEAMIYSFQIKK